MSAYRFRGSEMFVSVLTYRIRPGDEDAIVALHEDWHRRRQAHPPGFLSGELLHSLIDPQTFIQVIRFEDQAAAEAASRLPEWSSWERRIRSLSVLEPGVDLCHSAWQAE